MDTEKYDCFDVSALSGEYSQKTSLARYKELQSSFSHALIIFEYNDHYYGFDETAVALYFLFGCHYYQEKEMLVAKIEKEKFEDFMIDKRNMRGFRYVVDRNGLLTFEKGEKRFSLQKPLSYYKENLGRIQNGKAPASWTNSTKHASSWYDDVWAPGLPSSRFFKEE